jgi:hypothetical protein
VSKLSLPKNTNDEKKVSFSKNLVILFASLHILTLFIVCLVLGSQQQLYKKLDNVMILRSGHQAEILNQLALITSLSCKAKNGNIQ